MKGLVHHTPTNDDISNILKEFTVDFLLKGYSHLMQELYTKLLSDSDLVRKQLGEFENLRIKSLRMSKNNNSWKFFLILA